MPSRHSRNARSKQHTHIYQQPTPSSHPSPDVYPSTLPDDSAGSSGDDAVGRWERSTSPSPAKADAEALQQDYSPRVSRESMGERISARQEEPFEPLIDVAPQQETERPVLSQSLPTPPLPESSDMRQPQSESLLSPLWDDSGPSDSLAQSPILASLAGCSGNSLGDAFSRTTTNNSNLTGTFQYPTPIPTGATSNSTTFTLSSSTTSRPAKIRTNAHRHASGPNRTPSTYKEGKSATMFANAPLSNMNDFRDTSFESADRAAIAYSDDTTDLNDSLHLDSQHMEGTIRPSRRVSTGYTYGFSPAEAYSESAFDSYGRASHEDEDGGRNRTPSLTASGHARRAPQFQQPNARGSALSRALANPESKQSQRTAQSATQSTVGRIRSPSMTTPIPVSINGAPDEGDAIVSARWDYTLTGRRLLFLSYYPLGMQIWDCTDLGSILEILNLTTESTRQLIADGSMSATPNEESQDVVVEFAGLISRGSNENQGPLLGILVTPTEDKRDPVDEASDSVLLTSDDEVLRESADTSLLIYSLMEHRVIKRIRVPGLSIGGGRFEVGNDFVVVSTTVPSALHVFSSVTFDMLHQIPSSDILPFCHKTSSFHGLSTSHSSSRRHSFLETTSNIVNGIYNNYNEHFNDKYHTFNNRNNVLSPTVEHRFSSGLPSYSLDATDEHLEGKTSDYNSSRRSTLHGRLSQVAEPPFMSIPEPTSLPAPIFSVSGRLLAYASLPEGNTSLLVNGVQPRTSSTLSNAAVSTASAFGSTLSAQLASFGGTGSASGALGALGGISQADVGNAALKVGGSVLSGMKSLGGLAYKSAVAVATDSGPDPSTNRRGNKVGSTGRGSSVGGLANRFFSRSAPAATTSTEDRDRRYSSSSIGSTGIDGYEAGKTTGVGQINTSESNRRSSVPSRTLPIIENGYHVTVLDLASLTSELSSTTNVTKGNRSPPVVMHFVVSKSQPVSSMWFSASGTSMSIALRDGQTIQVYEVRPDPFLRLNEALDDHNRNATSRTETNRSDASRLSPPLNGPTAPPVPVYNLRRGRTPAVIESADWASDGRWIAIGTRKRTVHVFPVNPYGGPSDVQSHITGTVKNITEMPAMPTDIHPLVRLRVAKNPRPEQLKVPLAFTFLEPSIEEELRVPPNLLPPLNSPHLSPTHQHSYGSVSTVKSSSPSVRSDPLSLSPHQHLTPNGRPRNFQDILVFDPTDGVLSLRRISSDVKTKSNDGHSILGTNFGSMGSMGTSRSLPGTNAGGRLSMSTSPGISMATIGHSNANVESVELISRENTVASWILRREKTRAVKSETFVTSGTGSPVKGINVTAGQPNWLAQAELSTYSSSTRILPRPIYLSHQFSFRALGEDYHALIRRYKFDVAGTEIEVRKGVEVNAYPAGNSESFIEGGGFAIHYDRRRLSSSFDEPLASALTGGLDHTPAQPVLPMYPNGTPGTKPRSFKNTIPIKTIGDGMSESIGRFRRKVRSPQFPTSSDSSLSASVPLEFDEEDEDFLSNETQPVSSEHPQESDDLFEPERHSHDENRDQWPGWVGEDRKAVEEAERFDDISAVGFMDEEI